MDRADAPAEGDADGPRGGRVVHVLSGSGYEVYVGRAMPRYQLPASPWANPYKAGRDGTLTEVLALFERHARENIGLERIGMAFGYPSPILSCWCAPKNGAALTVADEEVCHAQVLLRLADEALSGAA